MICSNEPLALGDMEIRLGFTLFVERGFFLYDRDSKYEGCSCSKRRRQVSLTFGFQTGLFIRSLLRYIGPTYIMWRVLMDDCSL